MLYLIKSGKYMKIGFTDNLRSRMDSYKSCNPKFELLCISEGSIQEETEWHKKYTTDKIEWGLWKEEVASEFCNKAFLSDIVYFDSCDEETLEDRLKCEDRYTDYVFTRCKDDIEQVKFLKKSKSYLLPKIKVVNDTILFNPTISNSNILYIRNLIKNLKYKPKFISSKEIPPIQNIRGLQWIIDILRKEDKAEWTYDELANLFEPLFKEHNLKWSKKSSINTFFPDFKKSRKRVDKVLTTVYKFTI